MSRTTAQARIRRFAANAPRPPRGDAESGDLRDGSVMSQDPRCLIRRYCALSVLLGSGLTPPCGRVNTVCPGHTPETSRCHDLRSTRHERRAAAKYGNPGTQPRPCATVNNRSSLGWQFQSLAVPVFLHPEGRASRSGYGSSDQLSDNPSGLQRTRADSSGQWSADPRCISEGHACFALASGRRGPCHC